MSWTQPDPRLSLSLISKACRKGSVIDIGGGMSGLAQKLLDAGYTVAVLDISERALARAKEREGENAGRIQWIAADITAHPALGEFDVWHDRAVFHFLTEEKDREAYKELLTRTVPAGGHAVIATFSLNGPEICSGLPIARYSPKMLAAEIGSQFVLIEDAEETHETPWGKKQSFQYSLLKKNS